MQTEPRAEPEPPESGALRCTLVAPELAFSAHPRGRYLRMLRADLAGAVEFRIEQISLPRPVLSKYARLGSFVHLAREVGLYQVDEAFASVLRVSRPRRCVLTVYDLCPALRPELYPSYFPERLDARLARSGARRADAIVTFSRFQRDELAERLPFPPERIFVAHLAVDPQVFRPPREAVRVEARAELRERLELGEDTGLLLSMSGWQPRKNVADTFRALRVLVDRGRDVRLLARRYSATRGLWRKPLERLLVELELEPHIAWLPEIDDEETLARHFQLADVLLFPSRYEGFGLPLLEAMACGCPVVSSNVSTAPEVLGDAGLLVPPDDPGALADAVERILDDSELGAELARRGIARAPMFDSRRAAHVHLEAYRSVSA